MAIGSSICNAGDDDVSAAFDEEPAELRSTQCAGLHARRIQPNLTARQRQQPPSAIADWVFQILRFVSGVTISTTSTILQPPLRATKSFVLPEIGYALSSYYNDITPERVKLWLKVLPSFASQSTRVLAQSERGIALGHKISATAASSLETLSSVEMRRVVLSSMTLWIKIAHALQTPEVHDALGHNAELAIQLLEALSSHSIQKFVKDIRELVWAVIQLAADDQTVIALARVTATLCHALESEQLGTLVGGMSGEASTVDIEGESEEWSPIGVAQKTLSASDISDPTPVNEKREPSLPTVIHTDGNTIAASIPETKVEPSSSPIIADDAPGDESDATQLFLQVFEETMNERRSETIKSVLEKRRSGVDGWNNEEQVDLNYSFPQWWLSGKSSKRKCADRRPKQQHGQNAAVPPRRCVAIVGCLILLTLVSLCILFLLGLYGFLKLCTVERPIIPQPEVIVRVIREVVYVTSDGEALSHRFLGEDLEGGRKFVTENNNYVSECSAKPRSNAFS